MIPAYDSNSLNIIFFLPTYIYGKPQATLSSVVNAPGVHGRPKLHIKVLVRCHRCSKPRKSLRGSPEYNDGALPRPKHVQSVRTWSLDSVLSIYWVQPVASNILLQNYHILGSETKSCSTLALSFDSESEVTELLSWPTATA